MLKDNREHAKKCLAGLVALYDPKNTKKKHSYPEIETLAVDMLADLRHLCDQFKFDFAELDRKAYSHYSAEIGGR